MSNTSPEKCEQGTCLNLFAIERCNRRTLFHHSCAETVNEWDQVAKFPVGGELIWPGAQKHIFFSGNVFFFKCEPQMDCWKMKSPQATTAKPSQQPCNLNLL